MLPVPYVDHAPDPGIQQRKGEKEKRRKVDSMIRVPLNG
jgi:hypothetical protein